MTVLPDSEELTIKTGGQTLGGWTSIRVTRGVEMMPSQFECHITERFPGQSTEAIVIPGSTCTVYLGSTLVLTGFIDVYAPSYNAHTHNVIIAGRSNTEDIVDCSANISPSTKLAGSLKAAIQTVLKQFPLVGLSFLATDVDLPTTIPITVGMSAYDIIELLCKYGQKLLWDDQNGNLVVSDVGTTRAGSALIEGQNVEEAAARIDWSQRFNKIQVLGQAAVPTGSEGHISPSATATDSQIRSERLKYILMDQMIGPNAAQNRAQWEVNRRKGRSELVQITVTGWRDGANNLWTPNTIVNVACPTLKVNADLVISECDWLRGETGTQTTMILMPAQALQPMPFQIPPLVGGQIPGE